MSSPTSSHPIVLTLSSGARAVVLSSDGDKTTIQSPESSPPGSTVRGHIAAATAEFQLKVRNCVKVGNNFEIDGRVINAPRELKLLLAQSGKLVQSGKQIP